MPVIFTSFGFHGSVSRFT
ncbi:hypothetical protein [Klebsiella pneumoniae]